MPQKRNVQKENTLEHENMPWNAFLNLKKCPYVNYTAFGRKPKEFLRLSRFPLFA